MYKTLVYSHTKIQGFSSPSQALRKLLYVRRLTTGSKARSTVGCSALLNGDFNKGDHLCALTSIMLEWILRKSVLDSRSTP